VNGSLFQIGCQIADHLALGNPCPKLFKVLSHVLRERSLRRLQSGRISPLVDMGCSVRPTRFLEKFVAFRSCGEMTGFVGGLFGK
jgi:hypothetical protein